VIVASLSQARRVQRDSNDQLGMTQRIGLSDEDGKQFAQDRPKFTPPPKFEAVDCGPHPSVKQRQRSGGGEERFPRPALLTHPRCPDGQRAGAAQAERRRDGREFEAAAGAESFPAAPAAD